MRGLAGVNRAAASEARQLVLLHFAKSKRPKLAPELPYTNGVKIDASLGQGQRCILMEQPIENADNVRKMLESRVTQIEQLAYTCHRLGLRTSRELYLIAAHMRDCLEGKNQTERITRPNV